MKINNRTPIPNHMIALVMQAACDFTKADSEVLNVEVNPGKQFHGVAYRGENLIRLTLPLNSKEVFRLDSVYKQDSRSFGLRLYCLAVHEAQHVVDYQNNVECMQSRSYKDRQECENRAIAAASIAYDLVTDTTPLWLKQVTQWLDEFEQSLKGAA